MGVHDRLCDHHAYGVIDAKCNIFNICDLEAHRGPPHPCLKLYWRALADLSRCLKQNGSQGTCDIYV